MPFKTPFGGSDLVETSLIDKGLDFAKAHVPPNSLASQVLTKTGVIQETSVQPSESGYGSTPSDKEKTDQTQQANIQLYRNGTVEPPREIDEDENIATISIRAFATDTTGEKDIVSGFNKFFLQGVSEADQEKFQIVETFTSYYAFFYGKRPPIYTFEGILLNDLKQNWVNTFKYMYDNYFRGTAAADLNAQAVITYDKKQVSGYILSLNMNSNSMNPNGTPFAFTFLVIDHKPLSNSTDFNLFIQQEQEKLANLRAVAKEQINNLNKNPDGLKTILKQKVLQGKKPASSAKKKGEDKKENPESSRSLSDNTVNRLLKQKSTDY